MNNLELDELVYSYPEITADRFQTQISAREEFREVSGTVKEPAPKKGELFRHQKFIQRFMRQYDSQFIIHQVGTGKGCAVISVAEHYKAILDSLESIRNPQDNTHAPYKRAYVLVKGQTLIDEFKYQILCKCTDGDYINSQIVNSKSETARKGNITRSIGKFYQIETYGTFAKKLLEMTDQQVRIKFDNTIIIVDEVHNINPESGSGNKQVHPVSGVTYYTKTRKNKKTGELEEKIVENRLIYDQLWRLFHLASPMKRIVMSATPMINSASELGPRLNLILPEDRQIPDNINYTTVTLEELRPYFQGMISYVRALDTGAIIEYQGDVIDATYYLPKVEEILEYESEDTDEEDILNPTAKAEDLAQLAALRRQDGEDVEGIPSQMTVYATEMSEKQDRVYQISQTNPEELRPKSKNPGAFNDLERQTANFVFPDDSAGSSGFKKYVIKKGNRFSATPELEQWLRDPNLLYQLSTKFYNIVQMCKEDPGNCWCYSNFIRGGGAIVLGLCFAAQGFEEFTETTSVFSVSGAGGLAPVCSGKTLEDVEGERFVRISKGLRYALLTSETTGPEASALLELFNSYENRHGEYIKAVIGSPVTRDGLNLANVLQIHLVGPGWNEASSYQAKSRAIRSTSHVDLIEEERERLRQAGATPEEIEAANVTIRVFNHAAISETGTSIDLQMYQLSEIKDREIKRVVRMMKQAAVDCQINYARNVRPGDKDFSATCDYDVCAYTCMDPEPDYIETSSYDVLYSGPAIAAAQTEIKDIFRVVFSLPYLQLYTELKEYPRKFVDLAVKDLVENKIPINDRYGNKSYLREDEGTLYLSPDFPISLTSGSSTLAQYSETLLGVYQISLSDYNGLLQKTTDVPEDVEDFTSYIQNLTLENKIELLEKALSDYYVSGLRDNKTVQIINLFRNHIFPLYEPVRALQLTDKFLSRRGKGKGRKPQAGTKFQYSPEQEEEIFKSFEAVKKISPVYFHNLWSGGMLGTAHALTSKSRQYSGKIRLLKTEEGAGWRDAAENEETVYNAYIKYKLEQTRATRPDIYGAVLEDQKFRIIDKTTENTELASRDTRKVNRGRVCDTLTLASLFKLLWKLQYQPFEPDEELSRKQIIDFLIIKKLATKAEAEEFSDEQLRFYQSWSTSGKKQICEILKKYFEDNDLLF